MLIWLSFLVCFGTECHIDVPMVEPMQNMTECFMQGKQMIPQWEEDHPGNKVAKIRCTIGNRPQQENMI